MNIRSFLSRPKRQQGMTLLEILIALTIGLFILGGILVVYVQSNQSYRVAESTSRLQESARFAFTLLSREIRMAGYMGCFSQVASVNVIATGAPAFGAGTVLRGYEASVPAGIAGAVADTDSIMVMKASASDSLYLTGNMTAVNANIQISDNPFGIEAGDILFISDCSNADIFCANSVSEGNITITHAAACNSSVNLSKAYGADAMVMAFEQSTFFIMNNPSDQPALYMRPWNGGVVGSAEEQVEGVEDMQLCYGEDTDNNQSADVYRTAATVTASGNWGNVVSVRVALLMRTTDDGLANPQPYSLDKNCDGDTTDAGETVAPADRRIRRVFNSTIGIRNRLP